MTGLDRLNTFAHDDTFHVVVESPRGAAVKLKYDATLGAMSISRPLNAGITFPCDWGFVPSTKGPDGDPVDAAVWWDVATYPGVVIPCRALALVCVDQLTADGSGRIRNDRILAVPAEARREAQLVLAAVSLRVRQEFEQFLLAATALEGKDARVLGWEAGDAAIELIRSSAT
jgi:inorganic pyrophosphatase